MLLFLPIKECKSNNVKKRGSCGRAKKAVEHEGGVKKRLAELKIRGGMEIIEIIVLSRLARIPRRVLEIWGDWLSLRIW